MSDTLSPNVQPEPPTSPKDARKPGKTPNQIDLELRNARLEDENGSIKKQLKEMEKMLTAAKAAPSARQPGKSLLDELNDFLGV